MAGTLGVLGLAAGFAAADAASLYGRQSADASRFQDAIKFPLDLKVDSAAPYISMRFVQYSRRSIYEQPVFNDVMKISLPIPENLVDRTGINYTDENLGAAFGAATEALSGVSRVGGSVSDIGDRLYGAAAGVGVGVAQAAVGALGNSSSTVAQLISQNIQRGVTATSVLTGITTNPFQVVLFKSPDFRRHTFQWRLVPRNKQESDTIEKLVNTFKYHSLPGLSSGAVFFSYPEVLEIKFRPADQYLYKFKPCVVRGITVNYAPNSPSFYRSSSAPTAVQFSVELQEIELITKADYMRDERGRFGGAVTDILQRLNQAPTTPTNQR